MIRRKLVSRRVADAGLRLERFGLDRGHERTLGEVGDMLGVSRERVRQIEVEALAKLRRGGASRWGLADYVR